MKPVIFKKGRLWVPLLLFLSYKTSMFAQSHDCNCIIYPALSFVSVYPEDVNFSNYARARLSFFSRFSPLGRSDYAVLFILFHGLYTFSRGKNLKFEKKAFISMAVSGIMVSFLKYMLHRTRPNTGENRWEGAGFYFRNVSFPSGHTQVAFSLASSLAEKYGYPVVFYTLALFVGIARVARGMHYLSDVVIGAYSGYCVSKLVSGERTNIRLFVGRVFPKEIRVYYSLK